MVEVIFWVCSACIAFTYAGYPALLWIIRLLGARRVSKAEFDEWPTVSVIIAAKNEQDNISRRISNILRQDYPQDKVEIIVISDGSTDRTVETVARVANENPARSGQVKVIDSSPSAGKPTALNTGVRQAGGEHIVFTDARQEFAPDALRQLIANFADPEVGAVSGRLIFTQQGGVGLEVEMGAYWKYETHIRHLESESGSVMGVTGAIYAMRKELYQALPAETILDDVLTPLHVMNQGYRVVLDTTALAYDQVSANVGKEWQRKVRTLSGNWQLLSIGKAVFRPFENPWLYRFFIHKIARLLIPFFLVLVFITSLLAVGVVYDIIFIAQIFFYLTALSYLVFHSSRNHPLVKVSYFFCVLNVAAGWAFFIWITGRCGTIWQK